MKFKTLTVKSARTLTVPIVSSLAAITLTFMSPCNSHAENAEGLNVSKAVATTQSVARDAKIAHVSKRLAAYRRRNYPFTVYFPWGRCRGSYSSYVQYPGLIVGYMCGTYVRCRLVRAPRYICRW